MSDVWTSVGVIIGVGAAALTGWQRLDPIIAIAVAINIVRTGVSILRRSLMGLLDTAIPEDLLRKITGILARHAAARRAVPRAPDPPGRRLAVHRLPRAGAGTLVGAAGARPAGADRGGGAGRGAQQQRVHPPGADRGPGIVRGRAAWSGGGSRGAPSERRTGRRGTRLSPSLAQALRSRWIRQPHLHLPRPLLPRRQHLRRSPGSTASSSRSGAPMHGSSARL